MNKIMIRIFFSIFYSNFITPQASRSYNVCFFIEESLWIRQSKPEFFHSDSIRLHCRKIQNSVMNIFVAPSIVSVDILVIVKTMVIVRNVRLCERTVPPFSDLSSMYMKKYFLIFCSVQFLTVVIYSVELPLAIFSIPTSQLFSTNCVWGGRLYLRLKIIRSDSRLALDLRVNL